MSVATSTALAIGVGAATAGTQLAGAKIAAGASKKAAKTQAAAEERALALQRQNYQEAQTRYQPYQDVGTSSLPVLQQLAGSVQAPRYGQNLANLSVYGSPRPMSPPQGPMGPSQPLTGGPSAMSGGMVTIQAPTGATKQVPASEAQHWISKGAKVLEGRAFGGPVMGMDSYVVGEYGPEVFTPGGSGGMVTPNNQMQAGPAVGSQMAYGASEMAPGEALGLLTGSQGQMTPGPAVGSQMASRGGSGPLAGPSAAMMPGPPADFLYGGQGPEMPIGGLPPGMGGFGGSFGARGPMPPATSLAQPSLAGLSQFGQPPTARAGYVVIQTRDGQQRQVKTGDVRNWLQQGATVVGGRR